MLIVKRVTNYAEDEEKAERIKKIHEKKENSKN